MSRILIVSPCGTHPPTEGNRQRILALADALDAAGHTVHLAVLPNAKFDLGSPKLMRDHWGDRFHLLSPFERWTLGFRVRRQLGIALAPLVCRLTGARGSNDDRIATIDDHYHDWWTCQLALLQHKHQFDVVLAEYIFVSRALSAFPDTAHTIIDTHDIFSDRQQAIESRISIATSWLSTNADAESQALARADHILGIQSEESDKLRTLTDRPVTTVGHFIDLPDNQTGTPVRNRLLFVGSANPINADGCIWFIDQVLTAIAAAIPDVQLRVVGGVGEALAARYPSHPHLAIAGRVDDLGAEYANASAVINTVQFGTGLAIKSIEALAYGKPLICTSSGARGLSLGDGSSLPCLVADDPAGLAEATRGLLCDAALQAQLVERATRFVASWNRAQSHQLMSAVAGPSQPVNEGSSV